MLKLQKWGNSAAVRLPAEILKQLDMKIGDTLETEIRDNELVVRAVKRPRYRLAELLAQMQQEPPREAGWEEMADAGAEAR
ncbi:TPA: AbrB/MazE/SpoVT family DNA-binding domain-containing protein [Neisseria bacilliformis]|uniref:PemI family protein n=1 Tax=Neisseria bacilliformis ATCC BAA-1200 TaxID=888742 RepID=F2BDG0_9NEIS|nr:AbrB/MazE/SpoVT family DNA-binding domain-containing protein [Neisseria bacilliformis]EGF10556.1 pemI family protein [Neisseria bacilliformis ATCC BAA-1200]QMT48675.1 AbrB/MazE/SpoVT family DNA-binding domain-containing protein [Neisseria bacilliformis]